jgi:hypothetical protein
MLHRVAVQDASLTFSSAPSRKEEDAMSIGARTLVALMPASLLSIGATVTGTTTRKTGGG